MAKKTVKKEREKQKKNDHPSYEAKDIYVLEGLEPVRKRPGMYIGSTGPDGLHHLIWEVLDNSIDEAMAGYAKNITIELLEGNKVTVTDDGRGIPVDIHPQTKKSALETVMTTLHAGGKFGGESYKVSGGLHGVGVSVVNALSEWLRVEVCRNGGLYAQEYKRGKPTAKVKKVGSCGRTGTKVSFAPDPQVFADINFNDKRIIEHFRQQAFLTKGVRINFLDLRSKTPQCYGFYFEGGVLSFVNHLSESRKPLLEEVFYVRKQYERVDVEVAFTYVEDMRSDELSFANNIYNPDGGMHLAGFRSALTRTINSYARAEKYLKEKDENLISEDTREGLVAVVSVKLPEPQFEGQTKARLGSPEAKPAVESVMNEALKEFLEKRPREARKIIEKVLLTAKARQAAKAAKETVLRKGALEGLTLPGKLADCSSRSPAESELFLVEGDSAGGCWHGDTKVALVDGRDLSFRELIEESKTGKQNYCYTVKNDGHIGIAPVTNPRLTEYNAQVVKVILDTGEELICTPDHKFMLRDGTFKEAQRLHGGDSLMPLYRQYSRPGKRITIEGYEMVFDNKDHRWVFTHLLSDAYNLAQGVYSEKNGPHRHHKDFNKLNNIPSNINRLTREEHLKVHRELAYKTLRRPDVVEKVKAVHKTPEFREKIRKAMLQPEVRELLSLRAREQWKDEKYKRFMAEKFMEFYATHAEYREQNALALDKAQREFWSKEKNRRAQADRVKQYFEDHPEEKMWRSEAATRQWRDIKLREWRARKTREQWTDKFRARRREAYNKTYQERALQVLHMVYREKGTVDRAAYDRARKRTNDKTLLRYDTLLSRFFDNNSQKLEAVVRQYNHTVMKVIHMPDEIDVYDIEVPETHNFALACGVFVHNSAKQGRDRHIQAILPLKGKILNVEKSRIDKMLTNQEIRSLVVAIGTAIAEEFSLAGLRYHKIIIMTDADVDGAHIRTLLLTLFYRYFRPVIEGGYLYIAQPPLYRLQAAKEVRYAFSDAEKEKVIGELQKIKGQKSPPRAEKIKSSEKEGGAEERAKRISGGEESATKQGGINIQRYKGLGEMSPEQLWETTMNPARRAMKRVMIGDAEDADRLFSVLMGDEVEPRKKFIQAHATAVQNLDV